MSKPPYASTHPHPTHIDIPPAPPTRAPEDLPESLDGAEPMDAAVLSDDEHHLDQDLAPGAEMGRRPSASRPPPPRGILKNPLRRPSMPGPTPSDAPISPATDAERVQWDEANIAATEIQKDSLMKIDEPKTPFVRYDAENDMILGDVPEFDLRAGAPLSPSTPNSSSRASLPGTPSDTGMARRASSASSSRSTSSSRSASFSLPSKDHPVRPGGGSSSTPPISSSPIDSSYPTVPSPNEGALGVALGATQANTAANSGEVFADSDEEMDEEARARHKEFRGKMKQHYAKEAVVAMREAKKLLEDEEGEEKEEENGDDEETQGEEDEGVSVPVANGDVEMA